MKKTIIATALALVSLNAAAWPTFHGTTVTSATGGTFGGTGVLAASGHVGNFAVAGQGSSAQSGAHAYSAPGTSAGQAYQTTNAVAGGFGGFVAGGGAVSGSGYNTIGVFGW